MKNTISNIVAVIWFFGVVIWALIFGYIFVLGIIFADISSMLKSGFSGGTIGYVMLIFLGLIFAITGWVPAFRKCYYKLPWLYPLCMFMMMYLTIVTIAEEILAKGFSVINPTRHVVTIVIMILQIIVCRVLMCIYLRKNPMIFHKYDRVE